MSKPPSLIATLLAVRRTTCSSASRSSAPAPRRRRVPSINTFRCTSSTRRTSNPRAKTPAIGAGAGDGNHSLESIRPSFGRKPFDSSAISNFTKGLRVKASLDGRGKGMGFGKIHDRSELGKRLLAMRPEKRKGKWFSLQEMSERLAKVREAQHEEMGNRTGLPHVVADGLFKIHKDSLQKAKHKGPLG